MKLEQLFEEKASKSKEISFDELSTNKAIALLNNHCKNALWMLENNTPIYRGWRSSIFTKPFLTVDTMLTSRVSQNTSNWYTVLFDNLPAYDGWPKRSKSLIGSTGFIKAKSYAAQNETRISIIIPFDNAKIGICPKGDIWNTRLRKFEDITLDQLPNIFDRLANTFKEAGIRMKSEPQTYKYIQEIDSRLRSDEELKNVFLKFTKGTPAFSRFSSKTDSFLKELDSAMHPDGLDFYYVDTAEFKEAYEKNKEVWVEGKVVLISTSMWDNLRKSYKGPNETV